MTPVAYEDVVVRKHALPGARTDLVARLVLARREPWRTVLVSPLSDAPTPAPDGRFLTLWPRLDRLSPDEPPPWWDAGALLGRLHAMPVPDDLPPCGAQRLVLAARDLAATLRPGGTTDVLRILANELLDSWPAPGRRAVVHGDWNLGQLGRVPGVGTLLLGQPESGALDALGVGDPSWDLARPAALWAIGLLDDASWRAFLAGYDSAGGRAPAWGRPWEALEHPARCLVFRMAVEESVHAGDERSELADTLVAAAAKMVGWRR